MKLYFILIALLLFVNFIQKSNCYLSIGDKNANLTITLYLNIIDKQSSVIFDNFVSALKLYCFSHISNNIIQVQLFPVIDDVSNPLKQLLFYINALEKMQSANNCIGCEYLKFIKAYEYFIRINKSISQFQSLDMDIKEVTTLELAKEINSVYDKLDVISIDRIIRNYDFERIYNDNMIEYKFISLEGPIVYVNGVFINDVEKYQTADWEIILNDNKGNKVVDKCENPSEFYNNFLLNYI